MLLKSLFSSFKENIVSKTNPILKVRSVNDINKVPMITCEILGENRYQTISLDSIFAEKQFHLFNDDDINFLSKLYANKQVGYNQPFYTQSTKYFNFISLLFIFFLLLSNVTAVKISDFFGFALPGGIIFLPILYVLNDILTEIYGFWQSSKVIIIAFTVYILFNIGIYFVVNQTPAFFWHHQASLENIFLTSPRFLSALGLSYIVGAFINAYLLTIMKKKFKGRHFEVRALLSTLIGALLESIIFCTIAFYYNISLDQISEMIITLSVIKVLYEAILITFIARIVNFLKKREVIIE
ncbi:MAG: hypothetical protein K0R02_888 [Rickettsiaceae bacterium]|jgi:uncharacterized integral membrane protein (TIGR00697 family)|nr:hypothetical protein [Rickettsiaceae bacterium]